MQVEQSVLTLFTLVPVSDRESIAGAMFSGHGYTPTGTMSDLARDHVPSANP
jgi:hypothetical protein